MLDKDAVRLANPLEEVIPALTGDALTPRGREFVTRCPFHEDTRPSLRVNIEKQQWRCDPCNIGGDVFAFVERSQQAPFAEALTWLAHRAGLSNGNGHAAPVPTRPPQSPEREHIYPDERRKPIRKVAIGGRRPDGTKVVWQERPDGRGGWVKGTEGQRRLIYRLPDLFGKRAVVVAEGEKDVDRLWTIGIPATCNLGGAGNWTASDSQQVKDAGVERVCVIGDHDDAGRRHNHVVARSCRAHGVDVRVVLLPGVPDKGDVSDFCDLHGAAAKDKLKALLRAAAPWTDPEPAGVDDDEWPVPAAIQSALPPVSAFSEDLLPASFRPLNRDVAARMQVPMDYPAAATVLCLAGVVSRRAMIQPKANDTQWQVTANLWGAIIAPPGFMKTPVIEAITRPVNQIQREWRCQHDAAIQDYRRRKEVFELRCSAWKELSKSAIKSKTEEPAKPNDEPEEPTLRRLVVNDATFEALHRTMSENPAGVLVTRDEVTGWLAQLDKPGREGERAFCLEAWNGNTGFTIDRIARGTIHVEACCMSLLGGIQPGRFRSYLVDALKDGPSNDGLIQRFQLLVWPDTTPEWTYVDRAPDATSVEQADRVFRRLVNLDVQHPARFLFSADAQDLFVEWLSGLETRIRTDELHPALVSHLSKYRKLMPALALLFELADRAACEGFDGTELEQAANRVTLEHAQQAAAWCNYLESHARRVYSCVITPQMRAARELAAKIKARKLAARFSCRDVYQNGWSGLDTPELVKLAAELLIDAGWLRDVPAEPAVAGGRPSTRFDVNPKVWG